MRFILLSWFSREFRETRQARNAAGTAVCASPSREQPLETEMNGRLTRDGN